MHLIIGLDRPIEIVQMPTPAQRPGAFTALVGGLHSAPALVRQGESFEGMHVFLAPLALRALLGVPSAELAGRVVELSELWGRRADELVARLVAADAWDTRFETLDEVFMRTLRPAASEPAVAWAWRTLARAGGRLSVKALARDLGVSRRHFGERFRVDLGVTPKTAARIFRFERACRLIMDERPPLAAVAFLCGYHDQAHMTAEWNALAGCAPKAWIATELPFLQDYEVAAGDDARSDNGDAR